MKTNYLLILCTLILLSCNNKAKSKANLVRFNEVQTYVINSLEQSINTLEKLKTAKTKSNSLAIFKEARLAFKKAEPFASYLSTDNTLRVNGPPLPVYSEDSGNVSNPVGLQAIEETIFEDQIDTNKLIGQINIAQGFLKNILRDAKELDILPRRYFIAIHQQLLRIYTLSVTGFDTPTSLWGINESVACLKSLKDVYKIGIADTISLLNNNLNNRFINNIDKAIAFIKKDKNFETFNRYAFGKTHLNNLTNDWVAIRKTFGFTPSKNATALNMDAPTFFESNSFNTDFFRLPTNRNPSKKVIKLGELLFNEKRLSASGDLACVSCHNKGLAYQDGLKVAQGKNGILLKRNTPTIINTIYQKKFFWDGRSDELEQQITNVFDNENEFNTNAHAILANKILEDTSYVNHLKNAFPNKKISRSLIVKALAAYTSTLNAMNSRFDKNMRGEISDFTSEEILGMNLFMGKALCATCHFIPLTNGTVPPLFLDTEKEILGVPEHADNKTLDDDLGFYSVFNEDIHKYMFKTPTVRNIALTAPYMHNGVYKSLKQVMEFYNIGGGAGFGFNLPHQTLPFDNLNLTDTEMNAIIAFMKTLTDTNIQAPVY